MGYFLGQGAIGRGFDPVCFLEAMGLDVRVAFNVAYVGMVLFREMGTNSMTTLYIFRTNSASALKWLRKAFQLSGSLNHVVLTWVLTL